MSRTTVYVPCDTSAVSLGADRVAERLARECRDHPVDIVRNGSRGAFWLEPMLEVELEDEHGRILYELEVLTSGGTVRELQFDARSGELLEDEEED